MKTFKKSLFTLDNNGVIKTHLSDNFKNLLTLVPEALNIVDLPSYQTLSQSINDFDIRKTYGEIVIKTPQQILQEMYSVITSESKTLAEDYSNIWYYLNESGEFRYVYCFWDAIDDEWYCGEDAADTGTWDPGNRVFAPALEAA